MTSLSIFCHQLLRIKAAPAVELSTRVNKEGQAISYTSDYKHPATPETSIVDEFGKKVKNKDPATKKQRGYCSEKVSHNTKTKIEEGHCTSCASNFKHHDRLRPDDFEADGPGGGKTKPYAYQMPSEKHSWHKIFRNKKSSKYISKSAS